ncbi:MAG: DeoR/GlpR family DNA-binding transcription regulator [Spirochaetaceae bacterium]
MFSIERHQGIIEILKEVKSISVKELSSSLNTGEATIRRDLTTLEESGLLKRTHGGALLVDRSQIEIPLEIRESDNEVEKKIIAKYASSLIRDGEFIIIDSSSTTLSMVPFLKKLDNLTVLTNGAKTALDLAILQNIKVYSTGGLLREKSLSFIGQSAKTFLNDFNAHQLFFSCRSISMVNGISDFDEQEADLRKKMIDVSGKVVLLCDHTKFDTTSSYKIGSINCIDTIITDQKPSLQWIEYLDEQQVKLIY